MLKKIGLLMLVLFIALPAHAQDTPADCEIAALKALYTTTLDTAADFDALHLIQRQIAYDVGRCRGLLFEGDAQAAIGPVTITEGLYRVTLTVENAGIVKVTAIGGECEGTASGSLFNVFGADEPTASEAFFVVSEGGCTALIEVSNTRGAWSLIFEQM